MNPSPEQVAKAQTAAFEMHVPKEPGYNSVAELCTIHPNLREYIAQLEDESKDFRQSMAEALEEAFVEGWECYRSGEITNQYQWKRSDAKKLADSLTKDKV